MRSLNVVLLTLLAAFLVGVPSAAAAVTVGHAPLALSCGAPVAADWYRPSAAPTGLIWVQHGYSSSKSDVAGFAQDLANHTGALVVAPTITSTKTDPCWLGSAAMEQAAAAALTGNRAALTASARAAGYTGTIPLPFVLMGHSLGGNFALAAGGYAAASPNLRAVVLLDAGALDVGTGQATTALAALTSRTVLTVSSPPGTACKVAELTSTLVAARPGQFVGVQLVNGQHLDTIGYSGGGFLVCGWPLLQNVAAVQTLASQWATNALTGSTGGITGGTPGQTIPVGAATAVVLPA